MSRALILANEHVNRRMAGPAIRCFEFARALTAAGHTATLGSPFPSDLAPQPFPIALYGPDTIAELARAHDVVVLQGWVLDRFPILRDCGVRLVIDLYDPFPLEVLILVEREPLDRQMQELSNAVRAVTEQVRDGDFFLCASEKQRDYWLGWLTVLNRVNPYVHRADPTLRSLIDVVPFGVRADVPVQTAPAYREVLPGIGADDFVLLWGGGIYDWFDPVSLIRGVALAAERCPTLRLVFMSTTHPNPEMQEMWSATESRRVAQGLGLTGRHVFFNETWVEYDERANWYLEADVGVSTHFDHVETRFSFRTRMLDYFWCGLPVISTIGDTIADTIETLGLGRTVASEDPRGIASAIVSLAEDADARRQCSSRVRAHAASLTWDKAVAALVRYCDQAQPAPDLAAMAPRRRVPVSMSDLPDDAGLMLGVLPPSAVRPKWRVGAALVVHGLVLIRGRIPDWNVASNWARRVARGLRKLAE